MYILYLLISDDYIIHYVNKKKLGTSRLYHLRCINTWPTTMSYAYVTISCVYVALHVCVYREGKM